MDFEHTVCFAIQDALHAKEQYEKMLLMAEVKARYLKEVIIKEPMDKLQQDILRATLTEIIHLHKMMGAIERVIDKFLKENNNEGHS